MDGSSRTQQRRSNLPQPTEHQQDEAEPQRQSQAQPQQQPPQPQQPQPQPVQQQQQQQQQQPASFPDGQQQQAAFHLPGFAPFGAMPYQFPLMGPQGGYNQPMGAWPLGAPMVPSHGMPVGMLPDVAIAAVAGAAVVRAPPAGEPGQQGSTGTAGSDQPAHAGEAEPQAAPQAYNQPVGAWSFGHMGGTPMVGADGRQVGVLPDAAVAALAGAGVQHIPLRTGAATEPGQLAANGAAAPGQAAGAGDPAGQAIHPAALPAPLMQLPMQLPMHMQQPQSGAVPPMPIPMQAVQAGGPAGAQMFMVPMAAMVPQQHQQHQPQRPMSGQASRPSTAEGSERKTRPSLGSTTAASATLGDDDDSDQEDHTPGVSSSSRHNHIEEEYWKQDITQNQLDEQWERMFQDAAEEERRNAWGEEWTSTEGWMSIGPGAPVAKTPGSQKKKKNKAR